MRCSNVLGRRAEVQPAGFHPAPDLDRKERRITMGNEIIKITPYPFCPIGCNTEAPQNDGLEWRQDVTRSIGVPEVFGKSWDTLSTAVWQHEKALQRKIEQLETDRAKEAKRHKKAESLQRRQLNAADRKIGRMATEIAYLRAELANANKRQHG